MNQDYLFAHKPEVNLEASFNENKKRGRKKSVSRQTTTNDLKLEYLQSVFKSIVNDIDDARSKIQSDLLDSIYDNTIDYFNVYFKDRVKHTNEYGDDESDETISSIHNIIPTIAILTGINIQDHSNLCEKLCDRLKINFTKYLFVINEKNCQNMKNLIYSIFTQLKYENETYEKTIKRNLLTFRSFFDAILNDDENDNGANKSIIFVFKQFELIPKETIESFIAVLSCYVQKISIYFIIELASQSSLLYEQLSGSAISKLCIKKLNSMPASDYMDKFITKVFIENLSPFKLSGEILKYLSDLYNNYNFSISSFIHAIKYCIYDHIQIDNLNSLFIYDPNKDKQLYDDLTQEFKNQSILSDKIQNSLFKREVFKGNTLIESFKIVQANWFKYHNQFALVARFLFEIVKRFPSEKSEKSFVNTRFCDLYVQLSHLSSQLNEQPLKTYKKFAETEQFNNLRKLLQLSSEDTFKEIMNSSLHLIGQLQNLNEENYEKEFLTELNGLLEIIFGLSNNDASNHIYNDQNMDISPAKTPVKKSTRQSARLSLADASNSPMKEEQTTPSKRKRRSKAVVCAPAINSSSQNSGNFRTKYIDWITNQCSIYFDKDFSRDLEYSKYFCYTDIDNIKQRLFETQRIAIHDALLNPFKYMIGLNDSNRNKNDKDMLPLSLIYKLYLECGHMINLYDWLQAFVEKMENCELDELSEEKRKCLQALFFRSITELQFLGYIKQTSRKVDHVVKLTNIGYYSEN